MIAYKGGKCFLCGYNKCTRALGFHHRNKSDKTFVLSRHGVAWSKLKVELDKCDLLCANCHMEIEDAQFRNPIVLDQVNI
jgi:hypothetical protein